MELRVTKFFNFGDDEKRPGDVLKNVKEPLAKRLITADVAVRVVEKKPEPSGNEGGGNGDPKETS